MTTICYRAGQIATDSLVTTDNGLRAGECDKCGRTADGHLWAFCGVARYALAWREWAQDQEGDPPHFDGKESTGVLITPDGRVREWYGDGWCEVRHDFYAWGSGEELAMGAMAMGADAETAVGIAITFDTNSGGAITAHRLDDIPEEAEEAEEAEPFADDPKVLAGYTGEFIKVPGAPDMLDEAKARLGL